MAKQDNIFTAERLCYISDDIDNETIGKINMFLLQTLAQDNEKETREKDFVRKPIHIYINSFGGSVYDMWSLIDIISSSKTPIYTYCTGYAISAGLNIFLSGHKRFISKHATLMYHQISYSRSGKFQDLAENIDEMRRLQNLLEDYIAERTKLSQEEVCKIREKKLDFYVHAENAIELGFADEII